MLGHLVNQTKTPQLLPGFEFNSSYPNELSVTWNPTTNIRNTSIDYFTLKLIKFEDLDFYYKTFEKYKCQTSLDFDATNGRNSDQYSVCEANIEVNQTFIFNTVSAELEMDSEKILQTIQSNTMRKPKENEWVLKTIDLIEKLIIWMFFEVFRQSWGKICH